uniref:Cytochrome c oxidase subunit 3 n=1 Tax=Membranipora villosa TaxID=2857147 RepID=UPI002E78E14B|nr:Cytochrome c oxidase subunit 3 [Membranipora villosa]WQB41563.1 Cytochrome c oxidase subunit 3 [Membranipora villosa]
MYFYKVVQSISLLTMLTRQSSFLMNPYHLVEVSPWPLTGSLGALFLTAGLALWFHGYGVMLTFFGFIIILMTMVQWWRDVVREATYQGYHTTYVARGLRIGMILFIVSEVCFFFAFFWAFFHSSLAPDMSMGQDWPPWGLNSLNPWGVPLLNTIILLSSGVTVTWAHHALLAGTRAEAVWSLVLTIALGFYFTVLQAGEYLETSFTVADGVYGSTFFVATGFHGLHVMIGTAFLAVCLLRHVYAHFSTSHHLGFEAAAWYWHFVDVVWLFLFLSIYWWGSAGCTPSHHEVLTSWW